MGRGSFLGGQTILVRGQFGPEGPTIVKERRSKPFADDYDTPAKDSPKSLAPRVIRKDTAQTPARVTKSNPLQLDKFGLPVGLMSEGVPDANVRRQYLDSAPSRPYFYKVKSVVLEEARKGAQVLADFLIALNDRRLRTLTGGTWKRKFVSGVIYDIRMEKYLPAPEKTQSAQQEVPPKNPKRVDRMERPARLQREKALLEKSNEKAVAELVELELRICELEQAWDDAIGQTLRQKIHDQLFSARKQRKKIHESM